VTDERKEWILKWSVKMVSGAMGLVIMKIIHHITGSSFWAYPNLGSIEQMMTSLAMFVGLCWGLERPINDIRKFFASHHVRQEPDGREQWLAKEREKAKEEQEPPDDDKIRVIGYL